MNIELLEKVKSIPEDIEFDDVCDGYTCVNALTDAEALEIIEVCQKDLNKKVTQRGARMQILYKYLKKCCTTKIYHDRRAEIANWFNSDGVPK